MNYVKNMFKAIGLAGIRFGFAVAGENYDSIKAAKSYIMLIYFSKAC